MPALLTQLNQQVLYLTLNRPDKHNAFDHTLLIALQQALCDADANPDIHLIVIQAQGKHFCAGADLQWMQRMAKKSKQDNLDDALIFAQTLHCLHSSAKPTLAIVQGSAFGGGVGLIAACDMAIAAESACFSFPEVTLGLIPAVISPYVTQAMGARAANWLFMTAERINASRAQELQLIQDVVSDAHLSARANALIQHLSSLPPAALLACKRLVREISQHPLNNTLIEHTAYLISELRASSEGQQGMQAFLKKAIHTKLKDE